MQQQSNKTVWQSVTMTVWHQIKNSVLLTIRLYQLTLSPDHGLLKFLFGFGVCKFRPTCSMYTYDAIQKFGVARGIVRGLKRIVRCNPWSHGGYDPVHTITD